MTEPLVQDRSIKEQCEWLANHAASVERLLQRTRQREEQRLEMNRKLDRKICIIVLTVFVIALVALATWGGYDALGSHQ